MPLLRREMLVAALVLCCLSPAASAGIITVPTGLNPGDQYRLAFVTSTTRDARSTIIDDYNTFVTKVANTVTELAALGTTWKAIASTASVAARDNTNTVPSTVAGGSLGVPIYRLDNVQIAASNDDLWDQSLLAPINISEQGNSLVQPVWSGTDLDGLASTFYSVGATQVMVGSSGQSGTGWISQTLLSAGESHSWYAISARLTVPSPVPEPGTLTMLSIGAAMVWGWSRRRRPASVVRNPA